MWLGVVCFRRADLSDSGAWCPLIVGGAEERAQERERALPAVSAVMCSHKHCKSRAVGWLAPGMFGRTRMNSTQ